MNNNELQIIDKVNKLFNTTQLTLINYYIDYLNNYLSVESFAADYGISSNCAIVMIDEGRELQTLYSDMYQQIKNK